MTEIENGARYQQTMHLHVLTLQTKNIPILSMVITFDAESTADCRAHQLSFNIMLLASLSILPKPFKMPTWSLWSGQGPNIMAGIFFLTHGLSMIFLVSEMSLFRF